jgi:Skp family chaperone for outer membrane proteins
MTFRILTHRLAFLWALLLVIPLGAHAASENLYRYRNAEGIVVVGFQVPVDSVSGGYEVLNQKGMVIKVVPRELTEEERQSKDVEEKLQRDAIAEQERLRKWDESLMLRYSVIADIEDARRRALSDLQVRLSILNNNRRGIKRQIELYQAQAADTERAGGDVDVERLRVIEELQNEIKVIERDINKRRLEIKELSASYDADVSRFEMLQEAVELRRTLSIKKSLSP